ncbi:MAG: uroporphyrinogen decarboxylase family protein [Sedimentisphaerales bacterium]
MNQLERFKAVCRGQDVDYVPIIGFPGASGIAFGGAWGEIYQRLLETGMPKWVKGWTEESRWSFEAAKSWSDFWGTVTPLTVDFWPCQPPQGVKFNKKIEGKYEILEYETGAVTRQFINGSNVYSMPEFIKYHVRDRNSWELYKKLWTPGKLWPADKIEEQYKKFDNRKYPLFLSLESTWGAVRNLAGPEQACTMIYDDPSLVQEIIDWQSSLRRTYLYPLIERLKPEILQLSEDCCYKQGMLISPAHFKTFCWPVYREISELAHFYGADMLIVDTDGNIMELVGLLNNCGVNATYPVEAKPGNDLLKLRRQFPEFIFMGWLEKEVINEGNENLIEDEINNKVPAMVKTGRYFPNADHSLQPMCTFRNLCRFMNALHNVLGNPEGQFYEYS